MMSGTAAPGARRFAAGAASIVLGVGAGWSLFSDPFFRPWERVLEAGVALLPLVAGALVWNRRVVAQVAARGVWWCFLVIGAFIASSSRAEEAYRGTFSAVCAAVALLAVGRTGLAGREDDRFQPAAFRGTLLLSLVLAIADAVALTWVGAMLLADEHRPMVLALGVLMSLGVVGLLRLRTWGLLVALGANVLVATLALTRALPVSHLVQKLFACTALLQLVVPLPMLITLARRRAPGPDHWQRARWVAATLGIVTLAAFSVFALVYRAPFIR